MPPRFLLQQPCFKAFTGSSYAHNPLAALSSNPCKISVRAGSAETRERRRHDPFLMAQSRQRKAANLSRQQALAREREGSLGDPVESKPTPFIEELKGTQTTSPGSSSSGDVTLNYFVKPEGLKEALEYSKNLTSPLENLDRETADPQLEKEATERHLQEHRNAQEAINRIISINNGNTADHTRLLIQKCIDTFGRHNTDKNLPPKPAAVVHDSATVHPDKTPRVGPDTGSPEVQVAILTAKIINLSRHLQSTNKDKHNKRNLRLLVHKRQKLLRYLRKKERGGPRWQHLVETLGLSDSAWKGEISM
ncbi:mitochondrial 37S ribosomal protein uS15m [Aspergillus clavatus NRRL 1]|uniref:Ribosomal protein S15, putative n=1 Tax=Aspergillus clavatus (strain ATCC 1007 / CBS 513.65 / DSM 816 / NCTC 3887 / NRRL 1 / QM 1276 / 107) TaxID=344612 RepID=A1CL62_ASPCL|nr:ribosomal protein S15, putative [Aspergillus clavatus NRRL 1]EAW09886.1 ribosomal protein S15, putative [Aspergillus clavatus NRRL 1]